MRDVARKERNDLVRQLVKFVHKRDKRVVEYNRKLQEKVQFLNHNVGSSEETELTKLQVEANRAKAEDKRRQHLEERARMLEEAAANAANAAFEDQQELEEKLDRIADGHQSTESEGEEENFCVACNKQMRNARAYENHLKQKKHLDNVKQLRKFMMEDEDLEREMAGVVLGDEGVDNEDADADDDGEVEEREPEKLSKKARKKAKQAAKQAEKENAVNGDETSGKKSKKARRKEKKNKALAESDEAEVELEEAVESVEKEKEAVTHESSAESEDEDDSILAQMIRARKNQQPKANGTLKGKATSDSEENQSSRLGAVSDDNDDIKAKKTKKKVKNKNKAAAAAPVPDPQAKKAGKKSRRKKKKGDDDSDDEEEGEDGGNTRCAVCSSEFPSKNKLFAHLKATGHSIYIDGKGKKK